MTGPTMTQAAAVALLIVLASIFGLANLVMPTQSAGAQTGTQSQTPDPSDVADQLDFRGYYIDDSIDLSSQIDDIETAGAAINEAGAATFLVVLADEPAQGGDVFGRDVMNELRDPGSILVISNEYVNGVSTIYSDTQVGNALDAANDALDDGYAQSWTAFAARLDETAPVPRPSDSPGEAQSQIPTSTGSSRTSDSSGGSGLLIFILVIAAIGVGIWLFMRRGKKKNKDRQLEQVAEARNEIGSLISAISTEIVELEPTVAIADNAAAEKHYSDANVEFLDAQDRLEKAKTLPELEAVSQQLGIVRWNLDATSALLSGKKVPNAPTAASRVCFFDPSHRNVVETAEILSNGQTIEVPVCQSCAATLEKGEMPPIRTINAGGRAVPAPQAPTSHGGGGMTDLGQGSISLPGGKGGSGFDFSDTMGDMLDKVTRSGGGRSRSRGGMGSVLGGVLGGVIAGRSRSRGQSSPSRSQSRSRSAGSSRQSDSLKRGASLPPGPSGRRSGTPVPKPSSSRTSSSSRSRSSDSKPTGGRPNKQITGRARRRRK
ncbi:MAG: hypothetical protein KDB86_03545 [Actinobacteria bacterium]|nr:hypothetical protein [Actinomycetota bacterium]MCB9390751.1 hypothetical protein [Acidimicrobiia bacterium]